MTAIDLISPLLDWESARSVKNANAFQRYTQGIVLFFNENGKVDISPRGSPLG